HRREMVADQANYLVLGHVFVAAKSAADDACICFHARDQCKPIDDSIGSALEWRFKFAYQGNDFDFCDFHAFVLARVAVYNAKRLYIIVARDISVKWRLRLKKHRRRAPRSKRSWNCCARRYCRATWGQEIG